ncbi:MAG: single-stranded DNA-binding protein [Gemmatimonadaceae bacterium]|nr:single-stranded DNA-binding protein [Gemmatimonadaceae bacterium]
MILIGRCGRDPEIRATPNGETVANVSLATSEKWRDKGSGEQKERTEWHNLVIWGRQAEVAEEYVKKGDLIAVQGKIQSREYEDREGAKRKVTEIRVDDLRLLNNRHSTSDGRDGGDPHDDRDTHSAPRARQATTRPATGSAQSSMDLGPDHAPAPAPAPAQRSQPAPATGARGSKPRPTIVDMEDDIPF